MNTTTPVDVLAVMDAEIASLPAMARMAAATCDATEAVHRMTEARAAVAELIESRDELAKALRDILEAGIDGPGHVRLFSAGRAALARCGGA